MTRYLTLLLCLLGIAPAHAAEAPEPQMTWRMAFGAGAVETGYGLALDYRASDLVDAPFRVAALDVSDRAALARFAGMPLFQRDYRVTQNATAPEFRVALSKPWYAKSWVWWTAGGLAATAALGGAGSSTSESDERTASGRGGVVCNANVGEVEVGEECVVPCPGPGENSCIGNALMAWNGAFPLREPDTAWLDAGTGRMGDLAAR